LRFLFSGLPFPMPSPVAAAPADVPEAGGVEDEIERVYARQRSAFRRERPPSRRAREDRLRSLRDRLLARRADVKAALYADFRKPPQEVDATEISPVKAEIDHVLSHLKAWMKPQPVPTPSALTGTASAVRYEPKGTALILAPWNYPVSLTLMPLVSTLAAGNRAILKPSEFTPHATALMAEMVEPLFDEDHVALFSGGPNVAEALTRRPFDHIHFTGSPAIGKKVMQAAAGHLAPVTLELGGKSPAVVDETADVEDAARKIAWGKFTNAGQTCIAPDYALVHEGQQARFVYALRRHLRAFYGATPEERQATPDYARLVSDKHFNHVTGLLAEATEQGARVAEGGQTDAEECYVAPTILTSVPEDARAMQEEIFGPVLPVLPFSTLAGAVDRVNDRPNPLALYVFSERDANTEYVLERTTAGGSCVNEVLLHYLNPDLPFGGAGPSGIGRAHGFRGFKEHSNERGVLRRRFGSSLMSWVYPPYDATARRLIGTMTEWL
jgi:aldehyde dehydrogenase (NAD+)